MTDKTHHSKPDFSIENNPMNDIRRTIAVLSGKGGVGKSLVTSLLATYLKRTGKYRVGILDADITGPSIPKLFGAGNYKPEAIEGGLFPVRSHSDIQIMSINLLLDKPDAPVVWRGPILANTVKQFWTDVVWGQLDYLFLDMPPGTGDVPLTVFQSIPLDGIIIVTSPQDLVTMIVKKAVNMAKLMDIPILGIIENMSYAICPHCGESIKIFGNSSTAETAKIMGIPYLGDLPIDPELTALGDRGEIERIHKLYLSEAIEVLEKMPVKGGTFDLEAEEGDQTMSQANERQTAAIKKIAVPTDGKKVSEHFGHCEGFTLYSVEKGQVIGKTFLANPGHKPGLLPNLLNDNGVHLVIAGGIGAGAIEIFNEKGIDVISGAAGQSDEIISDYIQGKLDSTGSVCHEHKHSCDRKSP